MSYTDGRIHILSIYVRMCMVGHVSNAPVHVHICVSLLRIAFAPNTKTTNVKALPTIFRNGFLLICFSFLFGREYTQRLLPTQCGCVFVCACMSREKGHLVLCEIG